MGNIGDDFTTTVPAVGSVGTGYASDIDDILTEVVARLSTAVPVGSIAAAQSGETLDMNGQGIENIGYAQMYDQGSTPAGPPYNVFASYNGEVYWVSAAGVIQLTSGGTINMATTGGLVGDYGVGGNPAGLAYADTTSLYEFYDNYSTGVWAGIKASQIGLIDATLVRTTTVKASTAIAASWTLQLPPNDPTSGVSLPTINSSGVMGYADTTAITNGPLINSDVTLQNASKIKHGSRYLTYQPATGYWVSTGAAGIGGSGYVQATASPTALDVTPPVQRGWRIKTVTAYFHRINAAGMSTITVTTPDWTTSNGTAVTTDSDNTTLYNGERTVVVTLATPHTMAASEGLHVSVSLPHSGDYLKFVEVEYDVV